MTAWEAHTELQTYLAFRDCIRRILRGDSDEKCQK
jgi:hypothetical protein